MAQLIGELLFTGSLQNISAYKMRGSDKIIIRKKGGPSKKQIKHSPHFDLTRKNNKEFGGRSRAAAHIKRILHPLMFLADYNITGPLNALLKPIQKMDTDSERGKRNILITKHPRLLEGFTLNRRYLLESIVRTPVSCSIQEGKIIIDIPALLPGLNLHVPGNYNWYQFIAVAGLIPDMYYTGYGYRPKGEQDLFFQYTETDWLPVNTPAPAGQLIMCRFAERKPDNYSIMVAIGIAFGTMQGADIYPVKYVGGAKVVGMM